MERLTKKVSRKNYVPDYGGVDDYGHICNKLGQLEDIEEELGIDLITLFKALENGIYVKTKAEIRVPLLYECEKFKSVPVIENTIKYLLNHQFAFDLYNKLFVYSNDVYRERERFYLKDYGKTWALTKEELAKEKLKNERSY